MAAHSGLQNCMHEVGALDETLLRMATSDPMRKRDRVGSERFILKRACNALTSRRAWLWHYNESSGTLLCALAYEAGQLNMMSGPSISSEDCIAYLDMLGSTRILESPNLSIDPLFEEWAEFLSGERPSSMLHIPIRVHGRMVGLLWIEAKETGRRWLESERAFALETAGLLAQTYLMPSVTPAEDLLLAGRDRYLDLINNALDMLFVIDLSGGVLSANPVTSAVLGYRHNELVAMSPRDLIGEAQMERAWELIDEMIQQERDTCTLEVDMRCKDGSTAPIELKMWPVIQSGKILAVQGIGRDVSDRRIASEKQAALERQLFQAQRLESVGRLAGGIAHDFNNILTAIIGSGEIVLASLGEQHIQARHLNEILRSSQRAALLIRQLLAFSRKQVLQPSALDLNSVLRDIEGLLRRVIGEDIRLSFATEDGLPAMKADPAQIEQVIMNLVVNARDAMPTGGDIAIRTSCEHFDGDEELGSYSVEAGDYVCLTVTDTGCGMDEDTQLHVYEPFFTTKGADGSGTGLGLSTVYGIVKQSGGYITLESEAGAGSEFRVYLPAAPEKAKEPEPEVPFDLEQARSDATIMLVEDDDALRRLTSRMLSRQGYRVYQASNGVHALQIVRELNLTHLDLILADVVMPKMGGPEFAKHARELCPDARVVFMSGYARDTFDRSSIDMRAATMLQKPFSLQTLLEHIGRALEE